MVRNKIQCSYCGKMRAESEIFSGLCDTCAKKLQAGIITTEQIEDRKAIIKRLDHTPAKQPPTQPDPVPMFADSIPTQPDPVPMFADSIPTQPDPVPMFTESQQSDIEGAKNPDISSEVKQPDPITETGTQGAQEEARYYCDVCGAELRRGAYKCPKCLVVNDWRGTDVETDPDIIICDNCGAITDGKRCFNCGGGYDG